MGDVVLMLFDFKGKNRLLWTTFSVAMGIRLLSRIKFAEHTRGCPVKIKSRIRERNFRRNHNELYVIRKLTKCRSRTGKVFKIQFIAFSVSFKNEPVVSKRLEWTKAKTEGHNSNLIQVQ